MWPVRWHGAYSLYGQNQGAAVLCAGAGRCMRRLPMAFAIALYTAHASAEPQTLENAPATLTVEAAKAEPVIWLDHMWNVRSAKFACEKGECAEDPTLEVHMFEARITAAAALATKCKGVQVVKMVPSRAINPTSQATWFLKVDDWQLGNATQPWSLSMAEGPYFYDGHGDPGSIAGAICAIVKRH